MCEVWRNVPGYEGKYQVSNSEKVKSLDRVIQCKNGKTNYVHGKLLAPWINSDGYKCVELSGRSTKVHIIIAMAFPEICGEWFEGCDVHHKDHNKLNNSPENLIVITRSRHLCEHSNEKDYDSITKKALSTKHKRYPFGFQAKQVEQYKDETLIHTYNSIKEASELTGVAACSICNALRGRIKKAGGCVWKYA